MCVDVHMHVCIDVCNGVSATAEFVSCNYGTKDTSLYVCSPFSLRVSSRFSFTCITSNKRRQAGKMRDTYDRDMERLYGSLVGCLNSYKGRCVLARVRLCVGGVWNVILMGASLRAGTLTFTKHSQNTVIHVHSGRQLELEYMSGHKTFMNST